VQIMAVLSTVTLLSVCLIVVVVAQEQGNITADRFMCYSELFSCYERATRPMSQKQNGKPMSHEESINARKTVPLTIQCRMRQEMLDCMNNFLYLYGNECNQYKESTKLVNTEKFTTQFVCIDNVDDTAKYWQCIVDIQSSSGVERCYLNLNNLFAGSNKCSPKAFIQCFEYMADSVNTADCAKPGQLDGAKAWNKKLFTQLDQQNLLCPESNIKRRFFW